MESPKKPRSLHSEPYWWWAFMHWSARPLKSGHFHSNAHLSRIERRSDSARAAAVRERR